MKINQAQATSHLPPLTPPPPPRVQGGRRRRPVAVVELSDVRTARTAGTGKPALLRCLCLVDSPQINMDI